MMEMTFNLTDVSIVKQIAQKIAKNVHQITANSVKLDGHIIWSLKNANLFVVMKQLEDGNSVMMETKHHQMDVMNANFNANLNANIAILEFVMNA